MTMVDTIPLIACVVCLATGVCIQPSWAEPSTAAEKLPQASHESEPQGEPSTPLLSEAGLTAFLSPLADIVGRSADMNTNPQGSSVDLSEGARFGVTFVDLNPSDYDTDIPSDNGAKGSGMGSFGESSLLYRFTPVTRPGGRKGSSVESSPILYKVAGRAPAATIHRYRRMLNHHFRELKDKYFGNGSFSGDDLGRDQPIDIRDHNFGSDLFGADLLDSTTDEVEGWQPMVLANGSKYLCKIPSLSDYYGTGKGQYRGDDDVLVDLLLQQLEDESVISEYSSSNDGMNYGDNNNYDDIAEMIREDMVKAVMLRQSNRNSIAQQHEDYDSGNINSIASDDASKTTAADDEMVKAEKLMKPGKVVPSIIIDAIKAKMGEAGDHSMCGVRTDGWWTYESCWGSHVRQYHMGSDAEQHTIKYLGKGPSMGVMDGTKEKDLIFRIHAVRGPYMSMKYMNGTMCDITKEPRVTDVRLYCTGKSAEGEATDIITSAGGVGKVIDSPTIEIEEPRTCEYVVWMATPIACLGALKTREGPFVNIKCRMVDRLISK